MSKNSQLQRLSRGYSCSQQRGVKSGRREGESWEPEPIIAGGGGRKRRKVMEMSAAGRVRLRALFITDHAIIEYPGGKGFTGIMEPGSWGCAAGPVAVG